MAIQAAGSILSKAGDKGQEGGGGLAPMQPLQAPPLIAGQGGYGPKNAETFLDKIAAQGAMRRQDPNRIKFELGRLYGPKQGPGG